MSSNSLTIETYTITINLFICHITSGIVVIICDDYDNNDDDDDDHDDDDDDIQFDMFLFILYQYIIVAY